ncbi:MAG: DUF4430 domain-containing protein [Lachnospiraceae bacterium]|jgi:hypothetical protein|nr:DUF4430 domain-containing protein [Lachnospiraceae bacterium]
MTKKQKLTLVTGFVVIVAIIACLVVFFNNKKAAEVTEGTSTKEFQVEIISERDDFYQIEPISSDLDYLGEYLRSMPDCQWSESEYGLYITGFYGYEEDIDQEYWWCVYINDTSATFGADEIPLQDGDKYTFTLMQGW